MVTPDDADRHDPATGSGELEIDDRVVQLALQERQVGPRWRLAEDLARRGRAAMRLATSLTESDDENERILGAEVLGRVDPSDARLVTVSGGLLTSMLADGSKSVRASAALNIARLPSADIVMSLMLLRYDVRDGVRLAAAIGIEGEGAVEALVELSRDANDEVRSWATYRLAALPDRDPAALDALVERLDDAVSHVRGEALWGLARWRDSRAKDAIRRALESDWEECWWEMALVEMPDPDFIPLLESLLTELTDSEDQPVREICLEAIRACASSPE